MDIREAKGTGPGTMGGIDPGLTARGFVIIEGHSSMKSVLPFAPTIEHPRGALVDRLPVPLDEPSRLLLYYKPEVIAVEDFAGPARSSVDVKIFMGTILATCVCAFRSTFRSLSRFEGRPSGVMGILIDHAVVESHIRSGGLLHRLRAKIERKVSSSHRVASMDIHQLDAAAVALVAYQRLGLLPSLSGTPPGQEERCALSDS